MWTRGLFHSIIQTTLAMVMGETITALGRVECLTTAGNLSLLILPNVVSPQVNERKRIHDFSSYLRHCPKIVSQDAVPVTSFPFERALNAAVP